MSASPVVRQLLARAAYADAGSCSLSKARKTEAAKWCFPANEYARMAKPTTSGERHSSPPWAATHQSRTGETCESSSSPAATASSSAPKSSVLEALLWGSERAALALRFVPAARRAFPERGRSFAAWVRSDETGVATGTSAAAAPEGAVPATMVRNVTGLAIDRSPHPPRARGTARRVLGAATAAAARAKLEHLVRNRAREAEDENAVEASDIQACAPLPSPPAGEGCMT